MRDEALNEKGVGAGWEQGAAMQAQPLRGSESGQPKRRVLGLPAAGTCELRAGGLEEAGKILGNWNSNCILENG